MRKLVVGVALVVAVAAGCSTTVEVQPTTTTTEAENPQREIDTCKSEKETLQIAMQAFNAQFGRYPTSVDELTGPDGMLKAAPKYWKPSGDQDATVEPVSGLTLPDGCG